MALEDLRQQRQDARLARKLGSIDDLTLDVLRRAIEGTELPGKARILALLPQILERHVRNIVPPPRT